MAINLLEADTVREYSARPERLVAAIGAHPESRTIIIDEIQREPKLLSVAHQLIEEHPGTQLILTWSSARKLKRSGVGLLAGRALNKFMHPFMASELGDAFDLQAALLQGLVPIVVAALDQAEVLKTYIDIYIKEEVKSEGLVAQHLRAWLEYSGNNATMHYWRTPAGNEVNFVIYGEECFYALEVKASDRIKPQDMKALHAFKNDYPQCTPVLIYMGKERFLVNGVLCVPCRDFLLSIVPGKKLVPV